MNKTLKLSLFLAVVAAISGGLLGFVNSLTAPLIAAQNVTISAENGFVAGTYEGTAKGFSGNIKVTVEVTENEIVSITVDESENPNQLMKDADREEYVQKFIDAQSNDVDTKSGVTYSTTGIKDAITDALSQAAAN